MPSYLQRYYITALQDEVLCRFDSRANHLNTTFCYEELSKDIFQVTNVKINSTHLKRIFGEVKFDEFTAMHQLDTLALYVHAENWESFKSKMHQHILVEAVEELSPISNITTKSNHFQFNNQKDFIYILLLLISMIVILYLLNR